jgi:release factor glutamine methyltransferase
MSGVDAGSAATAKQLSIKEILARSTAFFASKGIGTARLDAERLLAEILGVDRLELYLDPDRTIEPDARDRLRELVRRRGQREPAQHILGSTGFYGLEIGTDPRGLIPRRETELLVDRALEIAAGRDVTVLDVGTGSGCIALALASKLGAHSRVLASDISADAIALAAENASRLGLAGRVTFFAGDLFAAVGGEAFDIIVANLPYVRSSDIDGLMPEVRDHEPRGALDGGADGLDVIRACVGRAPAHMAAGGWLLLEVGMGQAGAVVDLVRTAGMESRGVLRDAADIDRVVQAQTKAG